MLSPSSHLRRQHDQLLDLTNQVSPYLKSTQLVTKHAETIRTLLSKIAGLLKIHLSIEDQSFYPALLSSENTEVVTIVLNVQLEIADIGRMFNGYIETYHSSEKIQSEPEPFIKDTNALFNALIKRIEKENNELFPLYDKLINSV